MTKQGITNGNSDITSYFVAKSTSDVDPRHFQRLGNSSSSIDLGTNETIFLYTPTNNFPSVVEPQRVQPPCEKESAKPKKSKKRSKFGNRKRSKRKKLCNYETYVSPMGEIDKSTGNECHVEEDDSEFEAGSQKSISLLQDCYYHEIHSKNESPELVHTCPPDPTNLKWKSHLEVSATGNEVEVPNNWSLEEYSTLPMVDEDELGEDRNGFGRGHLVNQSDKSCQTDFSIFFNDGDRSREHVQRNMAGHINFIGSIVKLRCMLSSKPEISRQSLCEILNTAITEMTTKMDGHPNECVNESVFYLLSSAQTGNVDENASKETIKYFLRSSYVDCALREVVREMLNFFEIALETDHKDIALSWRKSVYEMAAEMLNLAVKYESKVRQMVDSFLTRIIRSVLNNETELQNFIQETRSAFIVVFCNSSYFCQDAIDAIIKEMKKLTFIKTDDCLALNDKFSQSRATKNYYFLIRTLQELLKKFIYKSENGETYAASPDEESRKNFNVLEMWRKHWRQTETWGEQNKIQRECTSNGCKWSQDLDEISVHCVVHFPIIANAVERCARLARSILERSHS